MTAPPCCQHTNGFHIDRPAIASVREVHNVAPEITITTKQLKRWSRFGLLTFTERPRPIIKIAATNGTWWFELVHRDRKAHTTSWRMTGAR